MKDLQVFLCIFFPGSLPEVAGKRVLRHFSEPVKHGGQYLLRFPVDQNRKDPFRRVRLQEIADLPFDPDGLRGSGGTEDDHIFTVLQFPAQLSCQIRPCPQIRRIPKDPAQPAGIPFCRKAFEKRSCFFLLAVQPPRKPVILVILLIRE